MPTYLYYCEKCPYTFEKQKTIAKFDTEEQCDKCRGPVVRQVTYPFIIIK